MSGLDLRGHREQGRWCCVSYKIHHYMCAVQKSLTAQKFGKDLLIWFMCSTQPPQALCNPNVLFQDLLEVYHLQLISELPSVKKSILKAYELTLSHMKFKLSEQVVGFADYQIKTSS